MVHLGISYFIIFLHFDTRWVRGDKSSFAEVKSKSYFVDKSELLKVFFENESPYNLINCPRRFAKTFNLRMIEAFSQLELHTDGNNKHYTDTRAYGLFNDTKIFKNYAEIVHEHMARYVVIYMDLRLASRVDNFTDDVPTKFINDKLFECLIEGEYSRVFRTAKGDLVARGINERSFAFMEKLKSRRLDETEVIVALAYIADILHKYFQADVILLVDEYDSAMVPSVLSKPREDVELLYIYINEMLIASLQQIRRILIASTSNLAFGVSYPDLSTFRQHTFLEDHEFGKFYGFSYDELDTLMERHEVTSEDDIADTKRYYCGYRTASEDAPLLLCNPYSVARYFESITRNPDEDPLKMHWNSNLNDDEKRLLDELMNYVEFRQIASSVIGKKGVSFRRADFKDPPTRMDFLNFLNFCKQKDLEYRQYTYGLFLNFVLAQGFLSYGSRRNVFVAPNSEIKDILSEELFSYKTSSKEILKNPVQLTP